jgi:DNA-binding NtrC family response regulator
LGERQMNLPENGRPPDGGKLKRLLVVDDEPNMAWLFRQTFCGKCEVIAAESGERALDLVKQDDVDVVMLDLRLPGMDGMETLREMKRAGLTAPVIIMTAYGEVKSAVQAMKLGAFDYITRRAGGRGSSVLGPHARGIQAKGRAP